MPTEDIRISAWSLTASAGMTASVQFTSPDALTSLSVYTGGTVTDVDDLTDATEHAGVLSGGDLIATVSLAVPTGVALPLRLVVNGTVQSVGRLHPSTVGTPTPDNTITLVAGVNEFELTILGVVESGGGGGGAPTDAGYLVTTAHADLTAEVVVGATPGGELGGTWVAPTVDAVHSGSSHAAVQVAAEATAAADATTKANAAQAAAVQRANHTGVQAISTVTGLQTALDAEAAARAAADLLLIPLTQKGAASGVATLDGSGTIPSNQLPALAISETFEVASQAAMLALTAQRGDVAIRTDELKSYILSTDSPGTLADWKWLRTPTDVVTSVDGRQGVVSLADLYDAAGAAAAAQAFAIQRGNHTGAQAIGTVTGLQAALDAKALDADVVHDSGAETIAGVKTFSSDPLVPDEAYDATAWNGSLEVPTKNAVRDKIETLGGGGTAIIGDWSALGNLGAAETVTGVDNTFVRSAGTVDQACTITVVTAADQVIDLLLTVGSGGPYQVTFTSTPSIVWHTGSGLAPEMRGAAVGEVHRFFFEDIAGTPHGYWLTEPVLNEWYLPTGVIGETIPRNFGVFAARSVLSTGRLSMHAVGLRAGQVVTGIAYRSLVTAGSGMTNQWFALFDKDRNKLGVTNDDGATAWAAAARKQLTLTSPVTCTYTGLYYVGIVVVGTTMPQLAANANALEPFGEAPILNGTSNTGLTNPASCPTTANAITATGDRPYAQAVG